MDFLIRSLCALFLGSVLGCIAKNPLVVSEHETLRKMPDAVLSSAEAKPRPKFETLMELQMSITTAQDQKGKLGIDVFRPYQVKKPKTTILIVPGQGNVSRKGKMGSDGHVNYEQPLPLTSLWGQALSDKGYFVMAYDKRTCTQEEDPQCDKEIKKLGAVNTIGDLASDLDLACARFRELTKTMEMKLVLFGTTQAAQVIYASECVQSVEAVVLVSPIVGNFGKTMTDGLDRLIAQSKPAAKKELIEKKDRTEKIFKALEKKGTFASEGSLLGAKISFWDSWISAVGKTAEAVGKASKPILVLYGKLDPFYFEEPFLKDDLSQLRKKKKLVLVHVEGADRNLVIEQGIAPSAVNQVAKFLEGLQVKTIAKPSGASSITGRVPSR